MKTLYILPFALIVSAAVCPAQNTGYYGQRPAHLDYRNQMREQANAPTPMGGGSCSTMGNNQLRDPRIEVTQQNTDGIAENTLRVKGYVEGVCLSEAGAYSDGQKQTTILIDTTTTFKRFPFELKAARGGSNEIRVYNTQGGQASYALSGN